MNLQIDEELQSLIPPLSPDELKALEESVLREGIRDAIVVWNGVIIDGHNRYSLSQKHDLEFETVERDFGSKDDVKAWMINNQIGRRNLSDGWKWELAQGLRTLLLKEGEKNLQAPTGGKSSLTLSQNDKVVEPHNTREKIAETLGWSSGKTAQAEQVWKSADNETKDKIKAGDVSISAAYHDLKKEQKKVERREVIETQMEQIEKGELPELKGKFEVISVDPPWPYGRKYDPDGSRVANPYPEMDIDSIKAIELPLSDNSIIFLWTTHQFLPKAFDILETWGATYKATLVWNKQTLGMGAWVRMQCEFCLVGIIGNPYWQNTTERDIISEPKRQHSRKPDAFFAMVEKITVGRRLEYFSREPRSGWEIYGNDTDKF